LLHPEEEEEEMHAITEAVFLPNGVTRKTENDSKGMFQNK
jgi:hypothetical protein